MEEEKELLAGAMGAPETHIKLADPNEDTYMGRVRKTFYMLDFRTAFTTEHALQDAKQLVGAHRRGEFVDPAKLEHAQYVTHAILHPDTGTPVFTPLRASQSRNTQPPRLWSTEHRAVLFDPRNDQRR
ncbi:Mitochondrial Tricarboxylate Carrier (MTC) Family [Phytophthora palmivora]|uniref:Mitochondrial Tricarboxylate Carrier (MTC) Family n=1 Tax=Phytophthora palmivora TaxID=4796 RepID=A0A2P4YJV8_9STRA|nr:Mitochondrial Tricarboxylate Carrier (MTC) Family [Phytophthora palmivora]